MLKLNAFSENKLPLCQVLVMEAFMVHYTREGCDDTFIRAVKKLADLDALDGDVNVDDFITKTATRLLESLTYKYGIENIIDDETLRDALYASDLILAPELIHYVDFMVDGGCVDAPYTMENLLKALQIFETDDSYVKTDTQNGRLFVLTEYIEVALDRLLIDGGQLSYSNVSKLKEAGFMHIITERDSFGPLGAKVVTKKGSFYYG